MKGDNVIERLTWRGYINIPPFPWCADDGAIVGRQWHIEVSSDILLSVERPGQLIKWTQPERAAMGMLLGQASDKLARNRPVLFHDGNKLNLHPDNITLGEPVFKQQEPPGPDMYGDWLLREYGAASVETRNWDRLKLVFEPDREVSEAELNVIRDPTKAPSDDMGGILGYKPMPGQQQLYNASKAMFTIICGGNSAGKTWPGAARVAYELLTGRHKGTIPVHGWVVRQAFPIDQMTDPVYARLWHGDEKALPFIPYIMQDGAPKSRGRVLRLKNGSSLEYRTWGQGWKRMAGHDPDFIWLDEPCPDNVFQECRARLLRKEHPFMMFSFTDLTGEPWIDEMIQDAQDRPHITQIFKVFTADNRHISAETVESVSGAMDDNEKRIRLHGDGLLQAGQVYKCIQEPNWRCRNELPEDGTDWCMIDPGISSECAVLWIRVVKPERREISPNIFALQSDLWLHQEYYVRDESNIRRHVAGVWEINSRMGLRPAGYFIDPHTAVKRIPTLGSIRTELSLWKEAGITVRLAPGQRQSERVERFRLAEKWFTLTEIKSPNIYIVRDMKYLKRELVRYRFDSQSRGSNRTDGMSKLSFKGKDHLIYNTEMSVAMATRGMISYLPFLTAHNPEPGVKASNHTWQAMSEGQPFSLEGYFVDGPPAAKTSE